MNVRIQVASRAGIESLGADLVDVYQRAFRAPPYAKSPGEVEEFGRFLPVHAGAPGYRLVVASDSDAGKVVGFIYGRTAASGQPGPLKIGFDLLRDGRRCHRHQLAGLS